MKLKILIFALIAVCFQATAQTQLSPTPAAAAGNKFGASVAAHGTLAVVGATDEKVGTQSKAGAAYLFNASTGAQIQRVTAPDAAAVDYFGNAAAIDGNTLLIAAHGDNQAGLTDRGSAYLYGWNGSTATFTKKLEPGDVGTAYDYFGSAVSLQFGRAVVGARTAKVGANAAQGAVYVFEENAGGTDNWGQTHKLTASDGAANNFFGHSVAQGEGLVFVGATGNNSNRGAVYVFDGTTGVETQKLTAPDAAVGDGFGTSVAVYGDVLAVGAQNATAYKGKVYLFQSVGGTWTHFKTLTASDGVAGDRFGSALAFSSGSLAVGASFANAVYFFNPASNFDETGRISQPAPVQRFGTTLAQGNALIIGAPESDPAGKTNAGQAFKL